MMDKSMLMQSGKKNDSIAGSSAIEHWLGRVARLNAMFIAPQPYIEYRYDQEKD
jgi:hypothetical protein